MFEYLYKIYENDKEIIIRPDESSISGKENELKKMRDNEGQNDNEG